MDTTELAGKAFSCLPGCGFCCTFPPEVSDGERQAITSRLVRAGETPRFTAGGGATHLALQGGCGACALLKDRECTQYDLRPSHCRYFPFHIYFGRRPEVYVNLTCRGVVPRAGAALDDAFKQSVQVAPDVIDAKAVEAQAVHARFDALAEEAGVAGDADGFIKTAQARAEDVFSRRGVEAVYALSGQDLSADELHRAAVAGFEAEDPRFKPYYLDPLLRWITFTPVGDGLEVFELHEDGRLEHVADVPEVDRWASPPPALRSTLGEYLRLLLGRDVFVGSACDVVDATAYDMTLEEALAARVGEVAADLVLRARLVQAMNPGVTDPDALAWEVMRFYDADFLDAPTIGGWL